MAHRGSGQAYASFVECTKGAQTYRACSPRTLLRAHAWEGRTLATIGTGTGTTSAPVLVADASYGTDQVERQELRPTAGHGSVGGRIRHRCPLGSGAGDPDG